MSISTVNSIFKKKKLPWGQKLRQQLSENSNPGIFKCSDQRCLICTQLLVGNKLQFKNCPTIFHNLTQTPKFRITIDAAVFEQVEHFTYLGQIITEDGRCEKGM